MPFPDYVEFIACLNEHRVKYLIVGAQALAYHFDDAWKKRVEGRFGSVRAYFISLDDLIAAKKAADRLQDRADVRILKKTRKKQTKPSSRKKK